jgi:hypothetical protein
MLHLLARLFGTVLSGEAHFGSVCRTDRWKETKKSNKTDLYFKFPTTADVF